MVLRVPVEFDLTTARQQLTDFDNNATITISSQLEPVSNPLVDQQAVRERIKGAVSTSGPSPSTINGSQKVVSAIDEQTQRAGVSSTRLTSSINSLIRAVNQGNVQDASIAQKQLAHNQSAKLSTQPTGAQTKNQKAASKEASQPAAVQVSRQLITAPAFQQKESSADKHLRELVRIQQKAIGQSLLFNIRTAIAKGVIGNASDAIRDTVNNTVGFRVINYELKTKLNKALSDLFQKPLTSAFGGSFDELKMLANAPVAVVKELTDFRAQRDKKEQTRKDAEKQSVQDKYTSTNAALQERLGSRGILVEAISGVESKKQELSTEALSSTGNRSKEINQEIDRLNAKLVVLKKNLNGIEVDDLQTEVNVYKKALDELNTGEANEFLKSLIKDITGKTPANMPKVVVDNNLGLTDINASANVPGNFLRVNSEFAEAINAGSLNLEQLTVLIEEIQHLADFDFGSYSGVQRFSRRQLQTGASVERASKVELSSAYAARDVLAEINAQSIASDRARELAGQYTNDKISSSQLADYASQKDALAQLSQEIDSLISVGVFDDSALKDIKAGVSSQLEEIGKFDTANISGSEMQTALNALVESIAEAYTLIDKVLSKKDNRQTAVKNNERIKTESYSFSLQDKSVEEANQAAKDLADSYKEAYANLKNIQDPREKAFTARDLQVNAERAMDEITRYSAQAREGGQDTSVLNNVKGQLSRKSNLSSQIIAQAGLSEAELANIKKITKKAFNAAVEQFGTPENFKEAATNIGGMAIGIAGQQIGVPNLIGEGVGTVISRIASEDIHAVADAVKASLTANSGNIKPVDVIKRSITNKKARHNDTLHTIGQDLTGFAIGNTVANAGQMSGYHFPLMGAAAAIPSTSKVYSAFIKKFVQQFEKDIDNLQRSNSNAASPELANRSKEIKASLQENAREVYVGYLAQINEELVKQGKAPIKLSEEQIAKNIDRVINDSISLRLKQTVPRVIGEQNTQRVTRVVESAKETGRIASASLSNTRRTNDQITLDNAPANAARKLGRSIGIDENLLPNIKEKQNAIKNMMVDLVKANPVVKNFALGLASVGVAAGSLTGLTLLSGLYNKLSQATQQAAKEIQQLNFALGATRGLSAKKEISDLYQLTSKLGVGYKNAAFGFRDFAGSLQGTSMEKQALSMFSAVQKAGAARKLTEQDMAGISLAMSQMASKGIISMEELRQQMAEKLPGTMMIAAKSMNMSIAEFNREVESGNLQNDTFLTAFTAALDRQADQMLKTMPDSLMDSETRLQNAVLRMQEAAGEPTLQTGMVVNNMLAQMLDALVPYAGVLDTIFSTLTTGLGVGLLASLGMAVRQLGLLDMVLKAATVSLKMFTASMVVVGGAFIIMDAVSRIWNAGSADIRTNAKVTTKALEEMKNQSDALNTSLDKKPKKPVSLSPWARLTDTINIFGNPGGEMDQYATKRDSRKNILEARDLNTQLSAGLADTAKLSKTINSLKQIDDQIKLLQSEKIKIQVEDPDTDKLLKVQEQINELNVKKIDLTDTIAPNGLSNMEGVIKSLEDNKRLMEDLQTTNHFNLAPEIAAATKEINKLKSTHAQYTELLELTKSNVQKFRNLNKQALGLDQDRQLIQIRNEEKVLLATQDKRGLVRDKTELNLRLSGLDEEKAKVESLNNSYKTFIQNLSKSDRATIENLLQNTIEKASYGEIQVAMQTASTVPGVTEDTKKSLEVLKSISEGDVELLRLNNQILSAQRDRNDLALRERQETLSLASTVYGFQDSFVQLQRAPIDFARQVEDYNIEKANNTRAMARSYQDLISSFSRKMLDLDNGIVELERAIAASEAKINLKSGVSASSPLNNLINSIIKLDEISNQQAQSLDQLKGDRLSAEESILQTARQVEDYALQRQQSELDMMRRAADLQRTQEDFHRQQQQAWLDITQKSLDIKEQASNLGIAVKDVSTVMQKYGGVLNAAFSEVSGAVKPTRESYNSMIAKSTKHPDFKIPKIEANPFIGNGGALDTLVTLTRQIRDLISGAIVPGSGMVASAPIDQVKQAHIGQVKSKIDQAKDLQSQGTSSFDKAYSQYLVGEALRDAKKTGTVKEYYKLLKGETVETPTLAGAKGVRGAKPLAVGLKSENEVTSPSDFAKEEKARLDKKLNLQSKSANLTANSARQDELANINQNNLQALNSIGQQEINVKQQAIAIQEIVAGAKGYLTISEQTWFAEAKKTQEFDAQIQQLTEAKLLAQDQIKNSNATLQAVQARIDAEKSPEAKAALQEGLRLAQLQLANTEASIPVLERQRQLLADNKALASGEAGDVTRRDLSNQSRDYTVGLQAQGLEAEAKDTLNPFKAIQLNSKAALMRVQTDMSKMREEAAINIERFGLNAEEVNAAIDAIEVQKINEALIAANPIAQSFQSSLKGLISGATSAKDALSSLLTSVLDSMAQMAAKSITESAFGMGGLLSGIGGLFGIKIPNLAEGGLIGDAMQRERSAGNKPILAVVGEGEYIIPKQKDKAIGRLNEYLGGLSPADRKKVKFGGNYFLGGLVNALTGGGGGAKAAPKFDAYKEMLKSREKNAVNPLTEAYGGLSYKLGDFVSYGTADDMLENYEGKYSSKGLSKHFARLREGQSRQFAGNLLGTDLKQPPVNPSYQIPSVNLPRNISETPKNQGVSGSKGGVKTTYISNMIVYAKDVAGFRASESYKSATQRRTANKLSGLGYDD